ncbi:DsbA family protein [Candidatus Pacearchaeota archaeon]|nr:DsbA family protein [Candidatus Pacearchaeota archaeon]
MESETITIKKESLWKYSTFLLVALLLIGAFIFFTNDNASTTLTGQVINNPSPNIPTQNEGVEVSIEGAPTLGEKKAKVTLIEFSDYQCPFCRKFWQDTLPQIKKDYIDTGKVKFVYKDFPLGFHPGAIPYAESARCAREKGGDTAYFEMHDKIFEEQNKLDGGTVSSTVSYVGEDELKKWAQAIGYDIAGCLDSGKYKSEIQKDLSEGSAAGVQGTPGFFLNGNLISGAQPYSVFKQAIDAELAG